MAFWGNAAGSWGTNRVLHGVGGGRFEVDLDSPLARKGVWPETFAWVDYDDDGDVDLFSATSGNASQKDYLFQNLGQGRFERVTDSLVGADPDISLGQAWGDYDNDGDLDGARHGQQKPDATALREPRCWRLPVRPARACGKTQ